MTPLVCPSPSQEAERILLAHGGGGRLMHRLIESVFRPAFGNVTDLDAAVVPSPSGRLAFTTDSFVVKPLFFPGGDIGSLAVQGTVNDLAMMGARPLWLSAGFILEEGLPMDTLKRIVASMQRAALEAEVQVVVGDTKVVEHGRCDGLYINTAGIGILEHDLSLGPQAVREGDAILLSGDVGRHGIAILAARNELEFDDPPRSDSAALARPVLDLLQAGVEVHCLRDLTRGGLATALVEIARSSGLHLHIHEEAVPVCDAVRGACELLGFDPLYVANEGCMVVILPESEAERALTRLRQHEVTAKAVRIGRVLGNPGADARESRESGGDPGADAPGSPCLGADAPGSPKKGGVVTAQTALGSSRVLDMLSGEQLPRIC
ncbi:MAG: hydrogenase expression/formation protein HypE [Gemmatales bacterium]|nr:hydrogenase expression/formation protein HypE [Gemmatales bacterium]MDW8386365.1 hydrogenase expression/formation protein HypE [Gemmatales bacterium]